MWRKEKDSKIFEGYLLAAFNEWGKIPVSWENYRQIKKRKQAYLPYLPNKENWEKWNDFPMQIAENGTKKYLLDCLINDYIEMDSKK